MIEQHPSEEVLSLIKTIETDPAATQRSISDKLGISLGKTNYLLKELIKKGFIKAHHFSTHPQKIAKINYILTQKGFNEMLRLTRLYLSIKEKEYFRFKKDWQRLRAKI
ncbi:MAG TPA: MarR family EPS-associated transcriptional regulator [Candidatus Omnitrophota bacterium]|nr:MarR family EPS-associated transcriptional regulator [Candidatus Omnitrophota bacterium]HRZ15307.1 MarR family EPS-associated transcriptional regulator [Candidatus Omnitrophota bacterium]